MLLCGCGRVGFDARDDGATDGAGTFCATQPAATFCSDFDSFPDLSDWTSRNESAARLTLVGDSPSPPAMLHVSTDSLPTINDTCEAYLLHSFDVSTAHAIVAFDLRIATLGQTNPVLAVLNLDDGSAAHGFEFVYRVPPLLPYLEERRGTTSPVYNSYAVSAPLPAGEWHRIAMEISLDVGVSTAEVRYDEQIVLHTTLAGTTGGTGQLAVGMAFLRGPSSGWALDIDNVVMTLR